MKRVLAGIAVAPQGRMKKMAMVLAMVIALAGAACVPPASISPERDPVLVIQNNRIEPVTVFDGAFRVATVLPGQSGVGMLTRKGLRSLTVRVAGVGTFQTSPMVFETTPKWTMTITNTGRIYLDLRP